MNETFIYYWLIVLTILILAIANAVRKIILKHNGLVKILIEIVEKEEKKVK